VGGVGLPPSLGDEQAAIASAAVHKQQIRDNWSSDYDCVESNHEDQRLHTQ
jgi:hypothetical protein